MTISEYGIKIKNISAGSLYEYNLGIRDYFNSKDAMLNNSLFYYYMKTKGLNVYKNKSTRDVICIDFDFGSKSYEDNLKSTQKLYSRATTDEERERLQKAIDKINANADKYVPKSKAQMRKDFYTNGVTITYHTKDQDGNIKDSETISYKMLYRTSGKAKQGQVFFINEKLYDVAHDWLTMGLWKLLPEDNADIVGLSAYAPLTTSTIIGTVNIPVKDILILDDADSSFKTMVKIVTCEGTGDNLHCVVKDEYGEVTNTLWDGLSIFESSIAPSYINGMMLLRNHFFKSCAFRGYIQKFYKDYCDEHGLDYETYEVKDYFGVKHKLKDIKLITTVNSIKWKKFMKYMGDTPLDAYRYWCKIIKADKNQFGIVKTDHKSKLGGKQQLSYQMVNTLPANKDDIKVITEKNIKYVEKLKFDNDEFEIFLRRNANEINNYEMLADLYAHNHNIGNTDYFREEKKRIISSFVTHLRMGKLMVDGDNLTLCGNPYALLLHSIGEDWRKDDTLKHEDGAIQCFTTRFENGEYLCAFRSPHNSPNNICYLHNVHDSKMFKYFEFSENILAVNCIETDIQSRGNGLDFDSDFFLVTNDSTAVKCAEIAYKYYPTIVNAVPEDGSISYKNNLESYARMDTKFAGSQMGIGYSSNLAQLAMTYYWTELQKDEPNEQLLKELYDCFVILSVLAQLIIDGCKRVFVIGDGMNELKRIANLTCLIKRESYMDEDGKEKYHKKDYPLFMQYTKEIKRFKNGKEIPYDLVQEQKITLKNRIDKSLVCPMNWMEEFLNTIKYSSRTNTVPIEMYVLNIKNEPNRVTSKKVIMMINDFNKIFSSEIIKDDFDINYILQILSEFVETMKKIRFTSLSTINYLIRLSFSLINNYSGDDYNLKRIANENKNKMLNFIYKTNKTKFLDNFV